jgi:hypothetical protein
MYRLRDRQYLIQWNNIHTYSMPGISNVHYLRANEAYIYDYEAYILNYATYYI